MTVQIHARTVTQHVPGAASRRLAPPPLYRGAAGVTRTPRPVMRTPLSTGAPRSACHSSPLPVMRMFASTGCCWRRATAKRKRHRNVARASRAPQRLVSHLSISPRISHRAAAAWHVNDRALLRQERRSKRREHHAQTGERASARRGHSRRRAKHADCDCRHAVCGENARSDADNGTLPRQVSC